MKDTTISKDIIYIGADDRTIDLFESQFDVPNGMSYNSYLIKDDKNLVMDTIDKRKTDEWIQNLENALNGEKVDFLVVSHMEPDHAYNIGLLSSKFPEMKIVGNDKTFTMMEQFFDIDNLDERKIIVKEGDTLNIGKHTFHFIMAPMVHWPEVMVTYEESEKILFSADGFGKFGALDADEDWACEARRYYFNICGKYGVQVQSLLKKAENLDIKMICPLHGPILKENLEYYIGKYDIWSKYEPEDEGIFIAYASIHGNTANAAKELEEMLKQKGAKKVAITDLSRDDMHEAGEDAFRYDKMVLVASSYNMGVFPPMEQFLNHLIGKNYQKRKVGIVQNGTWAPSSGRCMKEALEKMKDIEICEPIVTIKSKLNDDSRNELENFADNMIKF